MKNVIFKGTSLQDIRSFEQNARREVGFQIDKLQHGLNPTDYKPMPSIGKGVREIRVRDNTGAYRVIYIATFTDAIYVLSAFQKKQQSELNKAKKQYMELKNDSI